MRCPHCRKEMYQVGMYEDAGNWMPRFRCGECKKEYRLKLEEEQPASHKTPYDCMLEVRGDE